MTKFLDDTAASFFVRFVGAIHGPAARLEIDNLVDAATTERENQIGLEIKSGDETTVAAVAVHVHRIAGNPEGIGTSIRVIGSDIKAKSLKSSDGKKREREAMWRWRTASST